MINSDNLKNKKDEIIITRLNKTLTYENSTIIAFAGYGLIGYTILLMSLSFMAIAYSVYLVKTLYILKKKGWLIAFSIMVLPPLLLKPIFFKSIIASTVLPSVALFMFYLFCWILKFSVSGWLEDIKYANMNFDD